MNGQARQIIKKTTIGMAKRFALMVDIERSFMNYLKNS